MSLPLGAAYLGEGRCHFLLWAPKAPRVEVHITCPDERVIEMASQEHGYHAAWAEGIAPGALYQYRLDAQTEQPDPASRFQPQGVHGPSAVVDQGFPWTDAPWKGIELRDYVIYEIHVGTFTAEGTFEAVVPHLDDLKSLGITAIEIMPVSQFPGNRNWGYDGVFPFAVQNSYGGPAGLKRLVDACHARGLAVVLDVVYNHLGPEGNCFDRFGHYFTDCYRTPWGPAINFDGAHSDEVRRFFLENALYWVKDFHVDALRLDAIHAIVDPSARPFLEELSAAVHREAERLARRIYVIAESDRNDSRIIRERAAGGYGLDAQWSDDLHHALHALLTRERNGYYSDFGAVEHLAKAYREGFVYTGQYSNYRQRRHGNPAKDLPPERFVVCAQNHDQVGNRLRGERLSQLVSLEAQKLAAGVVLLSPFIPLLFMGEEYGETAPFLYFVSHSDPALIKAVREGRQAEFAAFEWQGEIPDPQAESTFERSKLHHGLRGGNHRQLYDFYRELLRLRPTLPAAGGGSGAVETVVEETAGIFWIKRSGGGNGAVMACNFGHAGFEGAVPFSHSHLHKILDSADVRWGGSGSRSPENLTAGQKNPVVIAPLSFVLYH